MAAAEITIGGWHEDVARIAGQAMANATPSVTAQTVPAETIPVVITVETAGDKQVEPEASEAPTVPEVPVVPTVPKV